VPEQSENDESVDRTDERRQRVFQVCRELLRLLLLLLLLLLNSGVVCYANATSVRRQTANCAHRQHNELAAVDCRRADIRLDG